jgi:hypothetical protein
MTFTKRHLVALVLAAAFAIWLGQARAQGLLACSATSLSVTQASSNVQLSKCGPLALIQNLGPNEAFYVRGATSAVTATTSNYSIPANTFQLVTVGTAGEWIAAIAATGQTATLRITQGAIQ